MDCSFTEGGNGGGHQGGVKGTEQVNEGYKLQGAAGHGQEETTKDKVRRPLERPGVAQRTTCVAALTTVHTSRRQRRQHAKNVVPWTQMYQTGRMIVRI